MREPSIDEARAAVAASAGRAKSLRVNRLVALATLLYQRFQHAPTPGDLDEAIDLLGEARSLIPAANPQRTTVDVLRALMLTLRQTDDDLADAITTLRGLRATRPAGTLANAVVATVLGMALRMRHARVGEPRDAAEAADLIAEGAAEMDRRGNRPAALASGEMWREIVAAVGVISRMAGHPETAGTQPSPTAETGIRALGIDLAPYRTLAEQVKAAAGVMDGQATATDAILEYRDPGRTDGMLSLANHEMRGVQGIFRTGLTGDLEPLDRILADGERRLAAETFDVDRASSLAILSVGYVNRARHRRMAGLAAGAAADLDRATDLAEQARPLASDYSYEMALLALGTCRFDRYLSQGERGDPVLLEEAVGLLQRAAAPRSGRPVPHNVTMTLAEALLVRGALTGPADVDRGIDLLRALRDRFEPGAFQRPLLGSRLAAALHVRAHLSEDTDDILRAADESRRVSDEMAAVSPALAYDIALVWAERSWERGRMADAVEAYGHALRALDRLVRAQLSRAYGELAVRRGRTGIAARAAYALCRRGRPADAAVALETGRAMLLSAALDRELTSLAEPEHAGLRTRYLAAVERLRGLEEAALTEGAELETSYGRTPR